MSHFPRDYADSRARFRARAQALATLFRGDASSFDVPSKTEVDLYVDDLYLPATASPERLIVVLSGIHGLEAYAGSAIQHMLTEEVLPDADRATTGFYLVHSMNPYGFKHHTRCTENHVNLNRNCGAGPELYRFENPASLMMSDRFIPKRPIESLTCPLFDSMSETKAGIVFGDVSLDQFIKAVGPGQFKSEQGLEFGGRKAEPQVAFLIERLRKLMPEYKDVVVCDLHTGLGHRGRLHLLRGEDPTSINMDLFTRHFRPKDDEALYDFTSNDEEGFYKTQGATNDLFPQLAKAGQRVCALTFEFGTLGHDRPAMLESLNRWLVEHQGTHHGYANADLEKEVRARYLDKFYPQQNDWKSEIVRTSRELFRRMLSRS